MVACSFYPIISMLFRYYYFSHCYPSDRLRSVMSGETGGHTIQQLASNQSSTTATLPQYSVPAIQVSGASKYTQLLSVGCLSFLENSRPHLCLSSQTLCSYCAQLSHCSQNKQFILPSFCLQFYE